MNKEQFIRVLQHYYNSSAEDAEHVLSLKKNFPYSQVLHALSARVSKDHGFSNHQSELQQAAIYAADRSVLKEIMTEEYSAVDEEVVHTPQTILLETSSQALNTTGDTDTLAEEVMHDLERLTELKHNFEMMFVDVPAAIEYTPQPHRELPEHVPAKETGKSRKERIIELARAVGGDSPTDIEPPKIKGRRKKKDDPSEDIIEEIASTKEEITPESERQKEQLEIIEQFIKIQPSISGGKEKQANPIGDLATIKTGEFGDNIVSETLVEILLKQGKKDKAIEVLKKLIWKFPQKKAYFAAQIEELRK